MLDVINVELPETSERQSKCLECFKFSFLAFLEECFILFSEDWVFVDCRYLAVLLSALQV